MTKFLISIKAKSIFIYSRDEMKQWHMKELFKKKNIKYILGDVRDRERLNSVLREKLIMYSMQLQQKLFQHLSQTQKSASKQILLGL